MANARETEPWKLESFLDSLILELDKAQDTLAIKGVTRKLTYTVKDLGVDLYVFPNYDSGRLRFNVAKPGESGASRLTFQLGSISDRQIREDGNEVISRDDISIDEVDEIQPELRDGLKRLGVKSARDLEKLSDRSINVDAAVENKAGRDAKVSYEKLADIINRARRQRAAPRVMGVRVKRDGDSVMLTLTGENLAVAGQTEGYPRAFINSQAVEVGGCSPHHLDLRIPRRGLSKGENSLTMALDPYALVSLTINGEREALRP